MGSLFLLFWFGSIPEHSIQELSIFRIGLIKMLALNIQFEEIGDPQKKLSFRKKALVFIS